ncbi:MAG: HD domain-containing protein [Oscillospiraceae bacterium]|nr:HD domain-containing protein [Oscillospiraceae bacterium]
MDQHAKELRKQRNTDLNYLIGLCAAGLAINYVFAHLATRLQLPLYLDNIGSALAAALGGYLPGIIVGFFTNIINGIGDYTTTYYGSLTVLIAIASAWFANNDFYSFRKPWKLLVVIVVFAFIGGGLGSILTYVLYGFEFGVGLSAPLARRLHESGVSNQFLAQFSADVLVDLVDKTITVLIVAVVLHVMPAKLKARFYYAGWQQTPITKEKLMSANKKRARLMSLRSKIVMLVTAGMIITGAIVTVISFIHFRTAAVEEQQNLAWGVANVASDAIDGDRVEEYIRLGEAAEGYSRIDKRFNDLARGTESIQYVYAYKILPDGCQVVFDADTPDTPGGEPGDMVEFDEDFKEELPDLLEGKEVDPIIATGQFGWLLTVYKPIYDSSGKCQCYVGVDVSMNHILKNGYEFLARVVSLFFGFFVLLLTATIWFAEYNIILPINALEITTENSVYNTESARAETVERIHDLDIRTGDEIESLYHSVTRTTEDMVNTLENVERQNEIINKLQNGLILVLADMVESRDKCTGDHVRKTAAYTDIIMRELKKEGVYADQLTDAFMYDVVNSAPLHDIGKIQVSDTILNKPGKLTDEEFEIMKTHTTAGAEVIQHAMNTVSEENSGYLKEAMNLAHYHHEKWNGTGYPCGLKGEEIPLSARIMAVADVFDALVSKRSYKDGFPFEKAMSIIKEGAGSHFDPKIAQAFLNASDEVRKVMNTNMSIE